MTIPTMRRTSTYIRLWRQSRNAGLGICNLSPLYCGRPRSNTYLHRLAGGKAVSQDARPNS